MENNQKTLIIVIDNFSFEQYLLSRQRGAIPFLSSLPPAEVALAAFKPFGNIGLATILSGDPPPLQQEFIVKNIRKCKPLLSLIGPLLMILKLFF